MGRDGRYDRSAFAHGLSHHLNHASSPLPPPLPAHSPPALSPAPNRPGGRTARWAERRRRPLCGRVRTCFNQRNHMGKARPLFRLE